jgi:ferredoxin
MALVSRRVVLRFPPQIVEKPIICYLSKDYNLIFNILKANITPEEKGIMIMELTGEEGDYEKGIRYLEGLGVDVQPLSQDIIWVEEKCTHCGACVGFCPSGALYIADREGMRIDFDPSKCIACEVCLTACPPRAMELRF